MYVNLPIEGILHTTRYWLNKHNNEKKIIEQTLHILNTILKQNYFLYDEQIFQPTKGIATGSPISSIMAEVYLQYFEHMYLMQRLDSREIIYYKRYVDDILLLYDQNRINEQTLLYQINNVDKNLQFKMTTETNNATNYLDITVHRNNENIAIDVYRKLTETGTVIHFTSNHPYEQKIAAFNFYINRMLTLPI
jgi:hypothetical protein